MQPFTYLKPHYESHITEYQSWLKLWVKQPVHVSVGDLTKQDMIIADKTGRATLTFWESNVETVMANLLYHFNNIIVCEYQGNKYLSLPKKDASISNIPDIGDVSEEGPQWVWRWRSHNTRGWSYQRVNLADVPGMCSMQSQTANNNWKPWFLHKMRNAAEACLLSNIIYDWTPSQLGNWQPYTLMYLAVTSRT